MKHTDRVLMLDIWMALGGDTLRFTSYEEATVLDADGLPRLRNVAP